MPAATSNPTAVPFVPFSPLPCGRTAVRGSHPPHARTNTPQRPRGCRKDRTGSRREQGSAYLMGNLFLGQAQTNRIHTIQGINGFKLYPASSAFCKQFKNKHRIPFSKEKAPCSICYSMESEFSKPYLMTAAGTSAPTASCDLPENRIPAAPLSPPVDRTACRR